MDEELPPIRNGEEKAFVGSMMTLTAVDLDEMIKVAAETSKLTDDLLRLEQLPQIIKYFGLELRHERYNLVGPDGTVIPSEGDRNLYAYTPLIDEPIGWSFPRVEFKGVKEALNELLRCEEGGSTIAFNPWEVKMNGFKIGPFALNVDINSLDAWKTQNTKISYINPNIEILTPFFRRKIKRKEFCCTEVAVFDPDSNERIAAVSDTAFGFRIDEGVISFDREVLVISGSSIPDAYKLAWLLRNPGTEVDCKPKFATYLVRLTPDTVFPLKYEFENGTLSITLVNLDSHPHLVTVMGAFRVRSARLVNLNGESENLNSEFDRVKFVLGRWKIAKLDLEVVPLIEKYLIKKSKLQV